MVKCEICQRESKRITHFHLETHGITRKQYLIRYPSATLESDEWRLANSRAQIGRKAWNKGLTKETSSSIAKQSETITGREFSPEHCQHLSEAKKGFYPMAGWNKGLKMKPNPARAEAISKALKGREITWGDKISQVKKEQCKDPEYARKLASTFTRKAWEVKPTMPELMVKALLDYIAPEEWAYVGNWAVNLGGLNPDFMNINGHKLLIEVFGDYWHQGEDPQKRIDHFKQFGFNTLVIWEKELKKPEEVLDRIGNFLSVETLHEPSQAEEDKVRHSAKAEINSKA